MDGPVRDAIPAQTPRLPPVDDDAAVEESAPVARASSVASSLTAVEEDAYANLEPTTHTHGWKPETMRSPVLLALAALSLLLALLIELLAQKAALTDHALAVVDSPSDMPPAVRFAHLYLPTMLAVAYSLAWNWVDLDVKRMQPWLQLSRDEGATGADSLLLGYPVAFVAFVPFTAAKQRHWASFYSGTIVVLVFWLLTPMQGAIFSAAPVLARRAVGLTYPLDLIDAGQQAALLDQAVLNAGYAVTWLGQALSAFTTSDYALRPFQPSQQQPSAAANWTGATTKYWTTLDCWPANVTVWPVMTPPGPADYGDGRGCNASGLSLHTGPLGRDRYRMTYVGYQASQWADYALASPSCGPAAWNEFLAAMAVRDASTKDGVSITAAFCEAKYWRQAVTATVDAATQRPVPGTVRPRAAPPEPLKESEFNTSAFQYLLGAGVSSVDRPREYPFATLLEHATRLQLYPLSPLVGFAIGARQNATIDQFADMTVLTSAFAAAHKMLFSVAYARLLTNSTSTEAAQGETCTPRYGVVVSRTFSALVEACLVLVALMTLLLLRTCRAAESMLTEDPASVAALLRLVSDGGEEGREVRALFSGTGHMSDEELRMTLGGWRLRLRCGCEEGRGRARLVVVGKPDYEEERERRGKGRGQRGYVKPVRPLMLRTGAGVLFIAVLVSVGGGLVYLRQMAAALGGLSLPSSSLEVNLLLTNYLPTAFSTAVEPLWVLLNRFHCTLQPFHDILLAPARSRAALHARYTSLPPQLAFPRALRAGHVLLAGVCVTALLGNVLAVGLGALLTELPASNARSISLAALRNPEVAADGLGRLLGKMEPGATALYDDPYYVVLANLSGGAALPPWTTAEYSFLPLGIPEGGEGVYTAETVGFGVDPGCVSVGALESSNGPPRIELDLPRGGCARAYAPVSLVLNNTGYGVPEGAAAAEVVDTPTGDYELSPCDETLILGWSRAFLRNRTGVLRTSMVTCSPTLRTARFRVSFDAAGHVLAATPVEALRSSWAYQNASTTGQPIIAAMHYRLRNRALRWHNDSVSHDWLNYLVKVHPDTPNSTALLDPATPAPPPAELLAPVSAVYKLMFAVLLSLNPSIFTPSSSSFAPATHLTRETRIFINPGSFIVCTIILGVYIIMAGAYYGVAVRMLFLPRMPSTVGSLLAYVAPSSIATGERGEEALGFGRYVGGDGRAQLGIDTVDRIVPLDVRQLGHGDTRPSRWKVLRWRRTAQKEDTWL